MPSFSLLPTRNSRIDEKNLFTSVSPILRGHGLRFLSKKSLK